MSLTTPGGPSKRGQFFRSKSTERTLKWLDVNYELCDDVCLPRCLLYKHYLDHCRTINSQPISAAAFGKIIRRKFSKIATRRLGTRGQSKYHYFGLAIRKSSPYYADYLENCQRLRTKLRKVGSRRRNGSHHLIRNVLPVNQMDKVSSSLEYSFPVAGDFVQAENSALYPLIESFLTHYKVHCNSLGESIISLSYESIETQLKHFWLSTFSHFHDYTNDHPFHRDLLAKVTQSCDHTFYQSIINSLFPNNLTMNLSHQMVTHLDDLIANIEIWLQESLIGFPGSLRAKKIEALHHFARSIKRYNYLFPLIKACSTTLNQKELLVLMTQDLRSLDLDLILDDCSLDWDQFNQPSYTPGLTLLVNFLTTLKPPSIDLDTFLTTLRQLFQELLESGNSSCIVSKSTQFILIINRLIVCLCKELTINCVPTLNHWINIFSTIREYSILIAEETIQRDHLKMNQMLILCWDHLNFNSVHNDLYDP